MNIFDNSKEDTVLILDIGNGSVGVSLSVLSKNAKPQIISWARELIVFEEKPDGAKLQSVLYQKLDETIETVFRKNSLSTKKISKVLCVLSSPWFFSMGKIVSISQEKAFVITERFLNDVLTKEVAFLESHTTENEVRIVEKSIIGSRVNGYVLKNPLNHRTNTFDVSVYVSKSDRVFIDRISDSISKHTHIPVDDVIFHSFPLVVFSVVQDIFPDVSDYLHLDVAGEITDVTFVSGGLIQNTVSFPTGKNLLVRQVSKRLSVPVEVARSYIKMYLEDRAEDSIKKTVQQAFQDAQREWNIYLIDAFATLSSHPTLLPRKVFLTAYPQTGEIFSQFLKHNDMPDELFEWRKNSVITQIDSNTLASYVKHETKGSSDVFLELESLFLSKFV